jgi:predicted aspartyl protease
METSRRLGRVSLGAILLSATIGASICAAQAPPSAQLLASIRNADTTSLAQIAKGPRTPETEVAESILAAFQGSDENAVRMLQVTGASSEIPPVLRFEAWRALADVHRRNGRFTDAVFAWEVGLGLGVKQDALEAQAIAEMVANDRALARLTPMQADVSRSAEVAIERNALRLPQAEIFMNGLRQEAVLDPGATGSVIADSTARRLGLRLLDRSGLVLSDGNNQARFAVADTLKFAGADFREVLFTVVTDDALTFAGGSGKVEVILGMPVMRRLGRLEFVITENGERLRRRSTRSASRSSSNMILAGAQPIVLVEVEGAAAPMRMALDSGAIRSSLTRLGASEFPTLMASAVTQNNANAGSSGATQLIPRMVLKIGDENVRLGNVAVAGGPACCHGVIGQDVLRSRAGYIVDFDAMRLELVSLSGASPRNLRGR